MSRPLRVEFPGALFHVTSRGNQRADIYVDDRDRALWLEILSLCCRRHGWTVHAWCQMNNHYHLLVEIGPGGLAAGMRQLNGVYTQRVNRRHDRVGHLFQGRYHAILVDRESYLLEVARYVVLNPVRGGLVSHPQGWPWSSYRATIGLDRRPAWLCSDWLLGHFGDDPARRGRRYAEFVAQGMGGPRIWDRLQAQLYLGSEEFVAALQATITSEHPPAISIEIPRAQRRGPVPNIEHFRDSFPDRESGIVAAFATGAYTQKAIADAFGIHYSTVCKLVGRAEDCAPEP